MLLLRKVKSSFHTEQLHAYGLSVAATGLVALVIIYAMDQCVSFSQNAIWGFAFCILVLEAFAFLLCTLSLIFFWKREAIIGMTISLLTVILLVG